MPDQSSSPTSGWPPTDQLGRIQPHKFNMVSAFRAFPWLIRYFDKEVPQQFWTLDSYAADEATAVVACPCGQEPLVPEAKCVECECGRFFLNLGTRILVARPEE